MMGLGEHDLKCADCGEQMHLMYLKRGAFYRCASYPRCKGSHGASPSGKPLGVPGDADTRAARIEAHAALTKIEDLLGKVRAYKWLATVLHLTRGECHIGRFDLAQCRKVIGAVASYGFAKQKRNVRRRRAHR